MDPINVILGKHLEENAAPTQALLLGHVHCCSGSPLDSHLCLYEKQPHEASPDTCRAAYETTINCRHILQEVAFARDAHVYTMSCTSGAINAVESDEVVGLVPALFAAIARSTVSCLWPV